jgi:hypothetical protein
MKSHFEIRHLLIVLGISATLVSCNPKADQADEHTGHDHGDDTTAATSEKAASPQFQVSADFQKQLANVFTSYVGMKDAFVSSDAGKVKQESEKVSDALAKVDMKLLEGSAHNDWMNYLAPMQKSLSAIENSDGIETQRKEFSTVSDNLYKSIKAYGLGGTEAFYEFCPMAFNNEGGYWLSDSDEIRNPYFGDAMLTCGSVQERLK